MRERRTRRIDLAALAGIGESRGMGNRPFSILGLQQIAVGSEDKQRLRRLWIDLLGLDLRGNFRSEKENVDEDIAVTGVAPHDVEVDLMQPIDPASRPNVWRGLSSRSEPLGGSVVVPRLRR